MPEANFDYRQLDEPQEEPDFNKLEPCPSCKKPIPKGSSMCLYCGNPVQTNKKTCWCMWVAVLLIISFILFSLIYS